MEEKSVEAIEVTDKAASKGEDYFEVTRGLPGQVGKQEPGGPTSVGKTEQRKNVEDQARACYDIF